MRIGAEASSADFLAVVFQLFLGKPPFKKGAGIDAWRRMRLEKHQISVIRAAVGMEEMVEARFEYLGGGGIARDVAAEFAVGLVGANNHGKRVPPNDRRDALLHGKVAGKKRLPFKRKRIAIGPVGRDIGSDTEFLGLAVER